MDLLSLMYIDNRYHLCHVFTKGISPSLSFSLEYNNLIMFSMLRILSFSPPSPCLFIFENKFALAICLLYGKMIRVITIVNSR